MMGICHTFDTFVNKIEKYCQLRELRIDLNCFVRHCERVNVLFACVCVLPQFPIGQKQMFYQYLLKPYSPFISFVKLDNHSSIRQSRKKYQYVYFSGEFYFLLLSPPISFSVKFVLFFFRRFRFLLKHIEIYLKQQRKINLAFNFAGNEYVIFFFKVFSDKSFFVFYLVYLISSFVFILIFS